MANINKGQDNFKAPERYTDLKNENLTVTQKAKLTKEHYDAQIAKLKQKFNENADSATKRTDSEKKMDEKNMAWAEQMEDWYEKNVAPELLTLGNAGYESKVKYEGLMRKAEEVIQKMEKQLSESVHGYDEKNYENRMQNYWTKEILNAGTQGEIVSGRVYRAGKPVEHYIDVPTNFLVNFKNNLAEKGGFLLDATTETDEKAGRGAGEYALDVSAGRKRIYFRNPSGALPVITVTVKEGETETVHTLKTERQNDCIKFSFEKSDAKKTQVEKDAYTLIGDSIRFVDEVRAGKVIYDIPQDDFAKAKIAAIDAILPSVEALVPKVGAGLRKAKAELGSLFDEQQAPKPFEFKAPVETFEDQKAQMDASINKDFQAILAKDKMNSLKKKANEQIAKAELGVKNLSDPKKKFNEAGIQKIRDHISAMEKTLAEANAGRKSPIEDSAPLPKAIFALRAALSAYQSRGAIPMAANFSGIKTLRDQGKTKEARKPLSSELTPDDPGPPEPQEVTDDEKIIQEVQKRREQNIGPDDQNYGEHLEWFLKMASKYGVDSTAKKTPKTEPQKSIYSELKTLEMRQAVINDEVIAERKRAQEEKNAESVPPAEAPVETLDAEEQVETQTATPIVETQEPKVQWGKGLENGFEEDLEKPAAALPQEPTDEQPEVEPGPPEPVNEAKEVVSQKAKDFVQSIEDGLNLFSEKSTEEVQTELNAKYKQLTDEEIQQALGILSDLSKKAGSNIIAREGEPYYIYDSAGTEYALQFNTDGFKLSLYAPEKKAEEKPEIFEEGEMEKIVEEINQEEAQKKVVDNPGVFLDKPMDIPEEEPVEKQIPEPLNPEELFKLPADIPAEKPAEKAEPQEDVLGELLGEPEAKVAPAKKVSKIEKIKKQQKLKEEVETQLKTIKNVRYISVSSGTKDIQKVKEAIPAIKKVIDKANENGKLSEVAFIIRDNKTNEHFYDHVGDYINISLNDISDNSLGNALKLREMYLSLKDKVSKEITNVKKVWVYNIKQDQWNAFEKEIPKMKKVIDEINAENEMALKEIEIKFVDYDGASSSDDEISLNYTLNAVDLKKEIESKIFE